jgi:hypothetical protein
VALTGTGIRRRVLELTTAAHDFGSVPVNVRQGGLTISLANVGQETAAAIAVSLSGPDAAEFEIEPTCPTSLTPGATCDNPGVLQAGQRGARPPAHPERHRQPGRDGHGDLDRHRREQPTVSLVPTSGDFNTVQVGQNSAPVTFDVTNTGGVATGPLRFNIVGTEFRVVAGTSSVCGGGPGGRPDVQPAGPVQPDLGGHQDRPP